MGTKYFIYLFIFNILFVSCKFSSERIIVLEKKLTLMIYMAADNDLEKYALKNLKEMERTTCKEINVLVLLDRSTDYDESDGNWDDTRLFEVKHDGKNQNNIISKRISCPNLGIDENTETELDMGNAQVLKNFIIFCKNIYKAKNYALIIWGHGTGWKAFAIDDRSKSYLTIYELGQAVKNQDLCVIGFDTCFASVIENLYELKDSCEFIVGSPGVSPSEGWNYQKVLQLLRSSSDSADKIAESMKKSSAANLTIVKSEKISNLVNKIEEFSKILSGEISDNNLRKEIFELLFKTKSYNYTSYPCDMFLDVFAMAEVFYDWPNPEITFASLNLKEAVLSSILFSEEVPYGIGIHFIPLEAKNTASTIHSIDYIKDENRFDQCAFIKQSQCWIPTFDGKSESLLNKLFYYSF